MSETLDALATVQALAGPVNDLGGRFMLHPDTMRAGSEAGYENPFWFYVAGRGGVLGDVDADVVVAGFGFFEPSLVRAMWEPGIAVEGARAAGHRYAQACAAWGRQRLAGMDGAERLVALAERVLGAASVVGLPLFAGWRAEPRPDDAPGRAYLLLHVLREWRGSAHVAAVATEGIGPLEAVVAKGGEGQARLFGWQGELPDPDTVREAMAAAEHTTDALLVPAFEAALTPAERAALVALVESARLALDAT